MFNHTDLLMAFLHCSVLCGVSIVLWLYLSTCPGTTHANELLANSDPITLNFCHPCKHKQRKFSNCLSLQIVACLELLDK